MDKKISITLATVLFLSVAFLFLLNFLTVDNGDNQYYSNNEEEVMNYRITLKTNKGEIVFETYYEHAPNTVDNFVKLARDGFYNNLTFHRVIPGFMIQGGCPEGTGTGGPGYALEDEIDATADIYQNGYAKGTVAMANAGPNTQGSQFFIMVDDYNLPPDYTIFGRVTSGQDVADSISIVQTDARDNPHEDVVIEQVEIEEL